MSSHVAQIFEHSSRETPEGDADPLMLLYKSLDVQTPDIARVVLKQHELRTIARNIDPRLSPLLIQHVHGYDLALASLLSVNGKGLKALTTETKAYNFHENTKKRTMGLREIFTGEPRSPNEPGINLPGGD